MAQLREFGAIVALWGLGVAAPALAQSSLTPAASTTAIPTLSGGGFTGLGVTPTAHLQRWGTLGLGYDNQLVGNPTNIAHGSRGHNLVVGFGLLPNLEVSGRIASNTSDTNCYFENCGTRDLSFNFKLAAPLDADGRWRAGVGATDLGGETGHFRSVYGVLTYTPIDPVDLSVGWGRRRGSERTLPGSPLHGAFASAAWRPLPWLQTHVEYADRQAWAGARVYAPAEWLPGGWQAHVGANVRLRSEDRLGVSNAKHPRHWVGVGLTIPLYKVPTVHPGSAPGAPGTASSTWDASSPEARRASAQAGIPPQTLEAVAARRAVRWSEFSASGLPVSATALEPLPHPAPDTAAPPAPPAEPAAQPPDPVTDAQLEALAEALRDKGFEDIAVGRAPGGAVAIRLNNAVYNVNTVDGLGVALGVVARQLAAQRAGYRMVLRQRGLDVVGVSGQADCLAQWIALGAQHCTAGQLYTPGATSLHALFDGTGWVVDGKAPSWHTPRLTLQPVLRSTLATEYGLFDYALGLRATLQQPLWRGAWAEVGGVTPVHESNDFKEGGVFAPGRFESKGDRAMFHQMLRLPVDRLFGHGNTQAARWGTNAVTAHVAAGRIDANYRGYYGELRWEPGQGRHRFGIEGGRFDRTTSYDRDLPIESRTVLGSYRYAYTPTRTYFEAMYGQFLYNDVGYKLGIRQWFDDVAVSLFVRRTKFEWAPKARTSAGIEVSIPLTPRKDMSPHRTPIQVTGNPRWSYGVATVIREQQNVLSTAEGVMPNVAMLDRTFNSDRAGLAYFEDNMPRIRSAARR